MTSSGPRAVVAAHGDLAAASIAAVDLITGCGAAFVAVSNRDLTPADIERRIREHVDAGAEVIFTDLQGGSCTMAARRVQRAVPSVAVVTGTSLAVLVDFAVHGELPRDEAVARSVERGRCALATFGSAGAH
jgi:mannose/fructose-specific phosphotransferase system component IIA